MNREQRLFVFSLFVAGVLSFWGTSLVLEVPAITIKIPTGAGQKTPETWTPLYTGVDFMRAETVTPLQKVCVLRIDTKADGISFYTTGRNKNYQEPTSETERCTTVDFLNENGLVAAVNSNFYTPFNAETRTTRGPANVTGLAISDGVLVSPPETDFPSFTVSSNGVCEIRVINPGDSLEGIQTGVAGCMTVLKNGEVLKQTVKDIHPRTAVGISDDGRFVYMMTIDGRQVTYSIGATYEDVGRWLKKFGASEGLCLDGGGSTTMVVRGEDGKAKVLNSPIGNANIVGYLRHNANHLGVRLKTP